MLTELVPKRQRDAIMSRLPATGPQIAKSLRWSIDTTRKRLKALEQQQLVQVVGESTGRVVVWGLYTGVPYVPFRNRTVTIPSSPYKTRWVGGAYPAAQVSQ